MDAGAGGGGGSGDPCAWGAPVLKEILSKKNGNPQNWLTTFSSLWYTGVGAERQLLEEQLVHHKWWCTFCSLGCKTAVLPLGALSNVLELAQSANS